MVLMERNERFTSDSKPTLGEGRVYNPTWNFRKLQQLDAKLVFKRSVEHMTQERSTGAPVRLTHTHTHTHTSGHYASMKDALESLMCQLW